MAEDPKRLDPVALERLRALNRPGDPDIVPLLLDAFQGDTPGQMETIARAILAGDAEGVRRTAHSLKSSAANLGAMCLSELCREMEELGRAARLDEAPALARRIEAELESVRAALAKLREE